MSALAVVALLASVEAVTSASEIRACLPLADGRVLAATSGGLVLYDRDLAVERLWTALDGLPGTDVHALLPAADGASVCVGTAAGVAALRPSDARMGAGRAGRGRRRARAGRARRAARRGDLGRGRRRARSRRRARGRAFGRGRDGRSVARDRARRDRRAGCSSARRAPGSSDGTATGCRRSTPLPNPYVTALGASARSVLVGTLAGVVRLQDGSAVSAVEARALRLEGSAWWAGTMGEGLRRLDMPSGTATRCRATW